jgi:Ca2+-binding RTX toxin-like protein
MFVTAARRQFGHFPPIAINKANEGHMFGSWYNTSSFISYLYNPVHNYGTNGDDIISGNWGNDTLSGGNGNDRLSGSLGSDWLFGGNGNDTLDGGADNDYMFGDAGNDWIDGGAGNDVAYGGDGNDTLIGGEGYDRLYAGNGHDSIYGGASYDDIYGGAGNDYIDGGTGVDYIIAGAGNDYVRGGGTIFGGSGNDYLVGSSGTDLMSGGQGQDYLTGGASRDIFQLADRVGDDTTRESFQYLSSNLGQSWAVNGYADVIVDFNASEGDQFTNVGYVYDSNGQGTDRRGYAEFGANVNSIEEAANYANRMYDEGRMTGNTGNVFIYNSATDTGYFVQDWDADAGHTFETGAILLNAGQADDMSSASLF